MSPQERAAIGAARDRAQKIADELTSLLHREEAGLPPLPASPPTRPPAGGLQKPDAFFDHLSATSVLGPDLTDDERTGCNAILRACAGVMPLSWAAYTLATAYHETAHTMQPIKEYGGEAYFRRMYDIQGQRPAKARELGNDQPGDGARYAGRGYPQLTGKANYRKATVELRKIGIDVDLVAEPDLAMRRDVAAAIMVRGMVDGWFTGKRLNDFIPAAAQRKHYVAARRIINGTDKADLIAGYALVFEAALKAGDWR
ncbi:hypothetical protein [Brevundimonas sp.]|uniref:hypothetical protein n=1 Tax=Brevundimonas sp. TaxID=1871086 RepID=UPI002D6D0710|nr:hypothetical protein [Brevundimonas sp.]HYD26951.1 hypothetical protein [Brevundimonas sp.]